MNDSAHQPEWKEQLDAIVGARAHGQFREVLPRLQQLDAKFPNVAEITYQVAWTLDTLDRAADAIPHYEKAVALGLPPNELSGALLGLGSALRGTGQAHRAIKVLRSGKHQFPENREFDVFLALALHDDGKHGEAVQLLLEALCDTTEDPGLTAYQRAIRHAASKLVR
ncbi:MAG TPA: tetratricopeptide repeat protein [Candidatus Didemnitutus sp.]|nr:tetratricopeptide repeat protein [Candidatus Didemnitutus sp.]